MLNCWGSALSELLTNQVMSSQRNMEQYRACKWYPQMQQVGLKECKTPSRARASRGNNKLLFWHAKSFLRMNIFYANLT